MTKTVDLTWGGEPNFYRHILDKGTYLKVDGEEYRVTEVISPSKYIIGKEGAFGTHDELVLEKFLWGWKARERGFLD
jgi:hypothetical protein